MTALEVDKDLMMKLLEKMILIRRFEERTKKAFADGEMPGFVHLYAGEEAVAVGCCSALETRDYITSTHRGHGHLIAKGGDIKLMMAELFGKKTGYCKGKGGSMHIADINIGILGANGIVGAGIPIAVGAALSAKLRKTDQVAISFFGDGASNSSRFHGSINLAAIWELPAVFIIENNQYAEKTNIKLTAKVKNLSERAKAYGIPGVTVNGNDVLEVYTEACNAVKRARDGKGPTLLECKTYRTYGHDEGDMQTYKPKQEVEYWKGMDPIIILKNKMINSEVIDEERYLEIDRAIINRIEEAVKFAKDSPFPLPEEALEDVYA